MICFLYKKSQAMTIFYQYTNFYLDNTNRKFYPPLNVKKCVSKYLVKSIRIQIKALNSIQGHFPYLTQYFIRNIEKLKKFYFIKYKFTKKK